MTHAEQVAHDFRNAAKTVSVATLARRMDGEQEVVAEWKGTTIFYYFADGSWLATKGRGKAHQLWTNSK